jgi:hypothetical protein
VAGLAAPLIARSSLLTGVAAAAPPSRQPVSPLNLELVTLTEKRAIITWYTGFTGTDDGLGRMRPAPTNGVVHWGTHPNRLNRVAGDHTEDTPYHYVELTGLEPGRTYYYQARSEGLPVPPTAFTLTTGNAVGTSDFGLGTTGPFEFTVPEPPPGRFLFAIALCNDLHIGETVAGLVGSIPEIKGIEQEPGLPPYPEVMLKSLVRDARARGARYLLAAGDITAEALPVDLHRAEELLDRFGRYRRRYFVARGNHDRGHDGDAYDECRVDQFDPAENDCFHDEFFPRSPRTYFRHDLRGLRVIGIDTYDHPGRGSEPGGLSPTQLAWFRNKLAKHRDEPTLVFGHHPLVVPNSLFPSADSAVEAAQAAMILEDYARTPGLFLHHAGHTHRNKRSISPVAPRVLLQEVAAGKEYPGGFTLLRLFTGGYALNFYKTRSELARRWSERSRQQIFGLWPQFALGSRVSDRNTVVKHDLSNLR